MMGWSGGKDVVDPQSLLLECCQLWLDGWMSGRCCTLLDRRRHSKLWLLQKLNRRRRLEGPVYCLVTERKLVWLGGSLMNLSLMSNLRRLRLLCGSCRCYGVKHRELLLILLLRLHHLHGWTSRMMNRCRVG